MRSLHPTRTRNFFCGLVAALCLACLALWSAGEETSFRRITVTNTQPRRDQNGDIIDAHDGCLQFFAGRYYLYGTAYGKSAGFGFNNRFRVYSSPDLEHWTFEGELLKAPPGGVYYRPCVIYNRRTHKYVLWYNWYPRLWEGRVGVAVSDTPVGPFEIVHLSAKLSASAERPGDGSLFVDDDGTGYFIYSTIASNHAIRIERLTPDFLNGTGESSGILGVGSEAPAMFRNRNRYYVLFDSTCCFCSAGSGARVFVASAPPGPYREQKNINRGPDGRPIVAAQQTFVARIPTSSGPAYLWMADRWNSRPDGIKGHDLQYWSPPLRFASDGSIEPMDNIATWSASIRVSRAAHHPVSRPYRWPKDHDSHSPGLDPCTGAPLPPED